MTEQPNAPRMHDDELEIDEALVRRLVAAQLPQWASQPIKRVTSAGTVNAVFRLGGEMAVRLPRTPRYHDVEAEVCWLRSLAGQLPLAIPEVTAVGEPDEGYPFKWSVLRWIEGSAWRSDRIRDHCSEASRLAEFLNVLHRLDASGLPCAEATGIRSLRQRDRAVRAYAAMAEGRVSIDAFLKAWERALEIPDWSGPPVLVHSDIMAGNLLVRSGRLTGVIDWASVHRGDPARDLEAAWRLFSGEARKVFKSTLSFDDDTWERARGYVLTSVIGVTYYAESYPTFAAENLEALNEALADLA